MTTLELRDNAHCIVCGKDNPIGLHAAFEYGEGRAHASLVLPHTYQGWGQVAHGGIVSALLDEAMFYALMSLGWSGVTAEITVRYLRPTPTEEPLAVEAMVETRHGRYGRAMARIVHEGKTVAEARGKFLAPAGGGISG